MGSDQCSKCDHCSDLCGRDTKDIEAKLQVSIESIKDVKEKISLAMDTCCFASVDIDYDEFDELTRNLEEVLKSLSNLKDEV